METSPQISGESQMGHKSLESRMEISAQSSDKKAIPLRDARDQSEHYWCQRGCEGSPMNNHLHNPASERPCDEEHPCTSQCH